MTEDSGARIVVIGGGTGSFMLLSSLKHYAKNITALVSMADDGGSTGILRDELGVLPPGDVRQCLVALSQSERVRELFNYRFEEGAFAGHAFGNIFLTALEKMTGSFATAVETAGDVLSISGRVEPITLDQVTLVMKKRGGEVVEGQNAIDNTDFGSSRPDLYLEPAPQLNPRARLAVAAADLVVIAPGNLYASLAPALIVPGLRQALSERRGKLVYVCNLVTKPGQTDDFTVADFCAEIERFAGNQLDYVLYNNDKPQGDLLERYAHKNEFGVAFDTRALEQKHYTAIGGKFISRRPYLPKNGKADPLARSRTLIRHDGDEIARALMKVYFS